MQCNQSVANPTKATKRGMDNMEEVPGVNGDVTNNACPTPAIGEMERRITQDPLEISRAVRPSIFPSSPRNYIISQDPRNLRAQ
jgi:hypothetical protein